MGSPSRFSPAVQLGKSVKAFAAKPLGRIAVLAFITLCMAGAAIYLGYLIAIPVFLVTGVAFPIYLGWTRARTLFLVGLAAILVGAPIVTAGTVSLLQTPSAAANGVVFSPHSYSPLGNATVHPYTSSGAANFTFVVDVNPALLPNGSQAKVLWVNFFLSTCPNAETNNSSSCGRVGAYPFHFQNLSYNSSVARELTFHQTIGGVNVWWWTIGISYLNATGNLTWTYLSPGTGYTTVEGPVTGDFLSIFELILPAIYFTVFVYLGLIFFLAVLIYLFLVSRRQRRAGGAPAVSPPAGAPTGPGSTTAPGTPTKSPTTGAPSRPELACPSCGAVVYAGETRCWKCGTPLTPVSNPAPEDQPLPSGKP